MKPDPNRDEFLNDLLAEEDYQKESLAQTLLVVRRRRNARRLIRATGLAVAACLVGWEMLRPHPTPTVVQAPKPATVPGTDIRLINDDELLALFAGHPVALIGPPGNQQLVFLDEYRKAKAKGGS